MWISRRYLSRALLRMLFIKTSNTKNILVLKKFNRELDRKNPIF